MTQHTPVMSDSEYRENTFFSIFGSVPEPGFESSTEQVDGWGRVWGCTSDVGRLRVVLMHRPGDELSVVENKPMPEIGGFGDPEKGWYWAFSGLEAGRCRTCRRCRPRMMRWQETSSKGEGVEIVYVGDAAPGRMKQVYTRDSVIGVKGGAVVARLARRVRRGEELPVTRALAKAGCPILGTLHGEAVFEGGGFAILDEKTAACSLSVACNAEGVRQMKNILGTMGIELIPVHNPGYPHPHRRLPS